MESTSVLIFGGVFFLGLIVVGVIFWSKKTESKSAQELSELKSLLKEDREVRFREQESLRNEIRDTNKSVDGKISEIGKNFTERLDKSAKFLQDFQKEVQGFSEKTGNIEQIGKGLESLQKIFRGTKARGGLGEVALEEIFSQVLPENLWESQFSFQSGEIVDFIIHTKSGLIPVDAKYPLESFERLVEADNEEQEEKSRKEFEKSVKKQIDQTSKYIKPNEKTTNFAMMFIPNENMYYEIISKSHSVADYARQKKILLLSPSTVYYALQVIIQAYQNQKFAKKATEALSHLQGVSNQSKKMFESLEVVERHIGNSHKKITETKAEALKLQENINVTLNFQDSFEEKPDDISLLDENDTKD